MIFKDTLSPQMSRAIKDNTTTMQRKAIALQFDISIHTLNSVLNCKRKVSKNNVKAVIEMIKIAIHSANEKGYTLSQYKEQIKKATEVALEVNNNH